MSRHRILASKLHELENALRLHGLWSEQTPDSAALQSTLPFCTDTLPIEAWLQFILLARLQNLINTQQNLPSLPAGQGMSPMVAMSFTERRIDGEAVLNAIAGIDRLLEES
jgi:uncharacterized protein YqcC (DUF446 family)